MSGGLALSKEFFELLKAIGESKSKQEEDRIICKEVSRLKQKLETPSSGKGGIPGITNSGGVVGVGNNSTAVGDLLMSSKKRAKEFLVRLLYVEMLGHDGSFGYIKAVEMAASASLYHKRTGYLVCGACLPPHHEFRFMLVNQMQRDLQSANVLEVCGGILAASNIITADMVPAVSTEVFKLLHHDSGTVRKKSIIALHRFYQLAPEVVTFEELSDALRKVLCDKEPSVMGSSLNIIYSMSLENPAPFKDLVPSLVSILKQIGDHRLPLDYDYHRVPSPWMQMNLVRILALLGKGDAAASSGMYEMLRETMSKADNGINAGYAICYECVKTIVTIYPNTALLDAAAETISRFIQSRSHNLKYLGVTGLAMIVENHPQYAAQHQLAVMDCLEDTDETLQRKTLDLLYRMTNPVNVEFISERLVAFLSGTTDPFLKSVLTTRVCTIAERYAPNQAWYIRTVTKLFEVSGDMVPQQVAQNLMSLIAEGTGESEEADMLLRQTAVEIYVAILRERALGALPRLLLETMAWVLGEYAYLSADATLDEVLVYLCQLARTHKAKLRATTRKFLVAAIMKLVAQAGTCPPHVAAVIDDYTKSQDVDLQQRCLEFQNLLTNCPNLLPEILPVDASAEDLEVDANLSFMDSYVQQALASGARSYDKPEDDDDDDDDYGMGNGSGGAQSAFKMTPYEKPQAPTQAMLAMSGIGSAGRTSSQAGVSLPPGAHGAGGAQQHQQAVVAPPGGLSLNTRNVANVWGRGGLATEPAAAPAAPAPAATSPAAASAWESHASSSSPAGAYGNSMVSSPSPPAYREPVKTAEQLAKERMAAGLFGGIVPGAPPPPPTQMSAPITAPPRPPPHAAMMISPAAPPPPPAAPEPEMDLLDMGAWDPAPATPAAAPPPAAAAVLNTLSPVAPHPAPAPPVVVETVTDDEDDEVHQVAAVPTDLDPFAGAGLLSDVHDKPLVSLAFTNKQKFEFNGSPMAPLQITTAQFGQQWGACPAASTVSVVSSKTSTLDKFMQVCVVVGVHKVEVISSTNEGICAGMLGGGSQIALIHGKVTPLGPGQAKIDATVKSTDQTLCGSLAMYMQTLLR